MLERISRDTQVLGGVPCIKGTRVPVSAVLEAFLEGMDTEGVLQHYPGLTDSDVFAALEYVRWLLSMPLPSEGETWTA